MISYKNTKAMVHDGETDFFDIVVVVLARRFISIIFVYTLPRL